MNLEFLNPPIRSSEVERINRARIAIEILELNKKDVSFQKDNRFIYWKSVHSEIEKELSVESIQSFQSNPVLGKSITGGSGRHYLNLINKEFGGETYEYLLKNHTETLCGEPKDLVTHDGVYITVTSMRHLYHCARIHNICHMNYMNPVDIWEIGGGFGNLARIIVQYNLCKRYFIVDHPVMHAIQFYYLSEFIPINDIAVLNNNGEYVRGSSESKVQLCSSWEIANVKDKMADPYILLSTMALTEIPNDYQKEYMNAFDPDFIYILGQLQLNALDGGKSAGEQRFSNISLIYELGERFHTLDYTLHGYFFEYIGRKIRKQAVHK